jgi:hypothetical protein
MTITFLRRAAPTGSAGVVLLAACLLPAAAPPAPAAPALAVSTNPVLYAVQGAHQGRPVAYVVLRTSRRVHDTDALRITVAGHAGRSYSVGAGSCIRAAFVRETPSGTPQPFLRPGLRYVVRVRFGDQTLATRTLSAHRISGERSAVPRC